MAAYILRRLALIIPTLFGMMLINFLIIQFVPGGPIEQLLSQLEEGAHGGATERFSGGGDGSLVPTPGSMTLAGLFVAVTFRRRRNG